MRLDAGAIDRSPIDRSGQGLGYGEFIVRLPVAINISASLSNESLVVNVPMTVPISVTITAPSAAFTVAITENITLSVKLTPVINIDKLLTSCTIRRSLADKMATATLTFDKTTVANLSSTLFWTKLIMRIPDYAGNWNVVFSGIAPSSQTNFTYMKTLATPLGNQTMTAFDYQWYLTAQTLEPEDQVLLKWADQQLDLIYKLEYDNVVAGKSFTVGDRVYGPGGSYDQGTCILNNTTASPNYLLLKAMTGSAPYFQDDEQLWVDVMIALANNAAVDVTGTLYQRYPSNYIWKLLGGWQGGNDYGAKWAEMTGICPKSAGNDSTWTEKEFVFSPTTTKAQAIEEICQYMKWIFYVRYETVSGTPAVPCAYFFDEANLDTVGCLPSPVYVTSGSGRAAPTYPNDAGGYLIVPFRLEQNGENQYNWIEVRCMGLTGYGKWYQAIEYDSDVYDSVYNSTGTVIKRPYYEVNSNIATQTDCTARASDLWTYYQKQVCTWTATFELRSDLALLQKLIVDGYGAANFPDGDYRIIDIEYDYSASGTRNYQKVTLVADGDFRAYLNLKRVYMNSVYEVQNIAKDLIDKIYINQIGKVIVGGAGTVTVAVDGQYGAVKRSAWVEGATLAVNDKVTLTRDNSGRLIATKMN